MRYLTPKSRYMKTLVTNYESPTGDVGLGRVNGSSTISSFIDLMKENVPMLGIPLSSRSRGDEESFTLGARTSSNIPIDRIAILNIASYIYTIHGKSNKTTGSLYSYLTSNVRYKQIDEFGKFDKQDIVLADDQQYSQIISAIDTICTWWQSHSILSLTTKPSDFDLIKGAIATIAKGVEIKVKSNELLCVVAFCRFIYILYTCFVDTTMYQSDLKTTSLVDALLNDKMVEAACAYYQGERQIRIYHEVADSLEKLSNSVVVDSGLPMIKVDAYCDIIQSVANTIIEDTSVILQLDCDRVYFKKDLTTYRKIYEVNGAFNLGLNLEPRLAFYDPNLKDDNFTMSKTDMEEFVSNFHSRYEAGIKALSEFVDKYYTTESRHVSPNHFSITRQTDKGTVVYKTYVYSRYMDSGYVLRETGRDSHSQDTTDMTVFDGSKIVKTVSKRSYDTGDRVVRSYGGMEYDYNASLVSDDEMRLFAMSFILPRCQRLGNASISDSSDCYKLWYSSNIFKLHPSATVKRDVFLSGEDARIESFGNTGWLEKKVLNDKFNNISWLDLFFSVAENEMPKPVDIHKVYCNRISSLISGQSQIVGSSVTMRTIPTCYGSVMDSRLFLSTLGKLPLSVYDRAVKFGVKYEVKDRINTQISIKRTQWVDVPVSNDNIVSVEGGALEDGFYVKNSNVKIAAEPLPAPNSGYRLVRLKVELPYDLEISGFRRVQATDSNLRFVFTPTVGGQKLETNGRVIGHSLMNCDDNLNFMDFVDQDMEGSSPLTTIMKTLVSINTSINLGIMSESHTMIYSMLSSIINFIRSGLINKNGPIADAGVSFVDMTWDDLANWCEGVIGKNKSKTPLDKELAKGFLNDVGQHKSFAHTFTDLCDMESGGMLMMTNTYHNLYNILIDKLLGIARPGMISVSMSGVNIELPTGILYDTIGVSQTAKTYLACRIVNQFSCQMAKVV